MAEIEMEQHLNETLSVQAAQERILAAFHPVDEVTVPLAEAGGRVLSADIHALVDLPTFTNSSMDGFALRAADTYSAALDHPVSLQVVEDIPAGVNPHMTIMPGCAARIMTGAVLPEGADAVIPVEQTNLNRNGFTEELPTLVQVLQPAHTGDYLRYRGQDVPAGQQVLQRSRRLKAQDLGMLAACGLADIPVFRLPKIALLSSGDELVPPGQPLPPGKIRDTNTGTLAALIRENGCELLHLGIVPDRFESIRERLQAAVLEKSDLIITSAGVSVGAYDYVKKVIEMEGQLNFWRVNMRPGKPVAFGSYQGVPLIGLPGNPVSAFVTFLVFVRPVLRRLRGLASQSPTIITARLTEPISSDGRESFLRAIVAENNGQRHVKLTGDQNSGNLYSLVQANALLIVPSGVKSLPIGSNVNLWLLRDENE